MGSVTFGVPESLALRLRDAGSLRHFVETGTYRANTARWAAAHFESVTTIEAYEPRYQRALQVLADVPRVTPLFGDSGKLLVDALPAEPALVWLDAHWMGDLEQSLKNGMECPILEEIAALNATPTPHYILIDDARLFLRGPERTAHAAQWPSYDRLLGLLHAGQYPRFVVVHDDVIIAVPAEAAPVVRQYLQRGDALSVSVLTSNSYVGCIPAFGYLFRKHWNESQRVQVVRYDKRLPSKPAGFDNFAIGNQADYTWSSGARRWLHHVGDTQVILFLEDYFLDMPADVARIEQLWDYMRQHPEVAKIDLTDDRLKVGHSDYGDGFIKSDENAPFQTSLQAAIWRVDFLRQFLNDKETPWQFEKAGTRRVIAARKAGKFDGLILGCQKPPLHYVNAVGGEGNKPGQFDRKKFSDALWRELERKGLVR